MARKSPTPATPTLLAHHQEQTRLALADRNAQRYLKLRALICNGQPSIKEIVDDLYFERDIPTEAEFDDWLDQQQPKLSTSITVKNSINDAPMATEDAHKFWRSYQDPLWTPTTQRLVNEMTQPSSRASHKPDAKQNRSAPRWLQFAHRLYRRLLDRHRARLSDQ